MGHKDHHEKSKMPVGVMVVTVSDTRTEETDTSGAIIKEKLTAAGNTIEAYSIAPDEPARILEALENTPPRAKAIIFNGGTGISNRDTTFDTIKPLFEKELPGFGEVFRMLSYEEIGSAAIMSRAAAGVWRGRIIISIPGSKGAVSLAMDKLIIPELSHMVWEITK